MASPLFRFSIWSNLFFLVPLYYAYQYQLWVLAALIFAVLFFGFAYHVSNRHRFLSLDSTAGWLLIGTNWALCYAANFAMPYFAYALVALCAAVYFYYWGQEKHGYEINHGLWHASCAAITLFSILTSVHA